MLRLIQQNFVAERRGQLMFPDSTQVFIEQTRKRLRFYPYNRPKFWVPKIVVVAWVLFLCFVLRSLRSSWPLFH